MKNNTVSKSIQFNTYQIKASLKAVKPTVWRRFQVPGNFSLYKLHKVMQALMYWDDYHLFEFEIADIPYGIPDEDVTYDLKDARRNRINNVLKDGQKALYKYDFGDGWECTLAVEKIVVTEHAVERAVCLAGKQASPPEDCGGPWGYADLLKILQTPAAEDPDDEDEEIKARREWIGQDWDPAFFDLEEVNHMLKDVR